LCARVLVTLTLTLSRVVCACTCALHRLCLSRFIPRITFCFARARSLSSFSEVGRRLQTCVLIPTPNTTATQCHHHPPLIRTSPGCRRCPTGQQPLCPSPLFHTHTPPIPTPHLDAGASQGWGIAQRSHYCRRLPACWCRCDTWCCLAWARCSSLSQTLPPSNQPVPIPPATKPLTGLPTQQCTIRKKVRSSSIVFHTNGMPLECHFPKCFHRNVCRNTEGTTGLCKLCLNMGAIHTQRQLLAAHL
jgi:hypothetical protein